MTGHLDLLLDMSATDVSDLTSRIHIERFKYSGDGLVERPFKAGDTIYRAYISVWHYSSHKTIGGYGRSLDEALACAVFNLKGWILEQLENAKSSVERERKSQSYWEGVFERVVVGTP